MLPRRMVGSIVPFNCKTAFVANGSTPCLGAARDFKGQMQQPLDTDGQPAPRKSTEASL